MPFGAAHGWAVKFLKTQASNMAEPGSRSGRVSVIPEDLQYGSTCPVRFTARSAAIHPAGAVTQGTQLASGLHRT